MMEDDSTQTSDSVNSTRSLPNNINSASANDYRHHHPLLLHDHHNSNNNSNSNIEAVSNNAGIPAELLSNNSSDPDTPMTTPILDGEVGNNMLSASAAARRPGAAPLISSGASGSNLSAGEAMPSSAASLAGRDVEMVEVRSACSSDFWTNDSTYANEGSDATTEDGSSMRGGGGGRETAQQQPPQNNSSSSHSHSHNTTDESLTEERRDVVLEHMPIQEELWNRIRDEGTQKASMFVSGWDDEEGVRTKDMSDPKEQFLTAAEEGDVQALTRMYRQRPNFLHVRDQDNYTPLHRAAYNNRLEACRWLLSVGADPSLRTENGWTVLHCAACWANYEVVAMLLSHGGVDVNSRSNGDLTPLHLAINSTEDAEKQYLTVKYLLEAPGIDIGAVNGAGDTPLMLAKRTSPVLLELLQSQMNRP